MPRNKNELSNEKVNDHDDTKDMTLEVSDESVVEDEGKKFQHGDQEKRETLHQRDPEENKEGQLQFGGRKENELRKRESAKKVGKPGLMSKHSAEEEDDDRSSIKLNTKNDRKRKNALNHVCVLVPIIILVLVWGLYENLISSNHSYRSTTDFEQRVVEAKKQFKNQDDFYWNLVKNSGLRHLSKVHGGHKDDLRPMSLLIAGYSGASETMDCFLSKISEAYTNAKFETISASDFTGDNTKMELDKKIKSSLKDAQKFLIIKNIEKLSFESAALFMTYADEYNDLAAFPQSTLILSTQLPFTYDARTKRHEEEGRLGEYFKTTVWKGGDKNYIGALWTRVGDGTILIRPEENNPCT